MPSVSPMKVNGKASRSVLIESLRYSVQMFLIVIDSYDPWRG